MNRRGPSAASFGSAILVSLTCVYALLVVLSSMAAPVWEFDEAFSLVHGVLVQQGAVPTIDFRSYYPPLGPYVTAAAFHLLGRTVIATRILGAGTYLFILVLLWRVLARQLHLARTKVAMALLLLAATLGKAIDLPAWQGFGLSMVALLVYFLSQEAGAFARLILGLSGLLTGLAVLYRVNFGGYVALVVAADLIIEYWPVDRIGWRNSRWKQALFHGAGFFVPMLACVFLFCLGVYGHRLIDGISEFIVASQKQMLQFRFIDLAWSLPLAGELLFPVIWFSLRLLSSTNKLSWRFLPGLALGLCLLILAVLWGDHASVVAIIVLCQIAGLAGLHFFVLPLAREERALLLFYGLQLHYYLSRADTYHRRFLPFVAVWLLVFLWRERAPANEWRNILFSRGLVLAGCIALMWIVLGPQSRLSRSRVRYGMSLIADVSLHRGLADSDRLLGSVPPGRAWESVYDAADELRALRHLRQLTTSTEPIFVGVRDHSKIFYNNLRIYWLSGRPIGVREFQLEDRIATEAGVQREIIHDLDQNRVNWAIIDLEQPTGDPSFTRRAYSGSKLLDDFILEHFKEESNFGRYAILRRATGPLPQARPPEIPTAKPL